MLPGEKTGLAPYKPGDSAARRIMQQADVPRVQPSCLDNMSLDALLNGEPTGPGGIGTGYAVSVNRRPGTTCRDLASGSKGIHRPLQIVTG